LNSFHCQIYKFIYNDGDAHSNKSVKKQICDLHG